MSDPITYWEQRCNLNEKVMVSFMQLVAQQFPPSMLCELQTIEDEWNRCLEDLEKDLNCEHDWVDATNEIIQSGEVCKNCLAIRPSTTDAD